ncbi:MAG: polysaccharide deacetylase family protein [Halioglobus sp.]|nr:polysaccharide deacetylase family protein [Halioglobus sp.]
MFRKIIVYVALMIMIFVAILLWAYSGAIVKAPVTEKLVALTYDDGPNPPHTQNLLGMLNRHSVKVTFFPKGQNIEAFPESVRAIVREGHEIGNHSYSHNPMVSLSKTDMLEELVLSNRLIENLVGYEPVLFRPPYGIQGPGLKMALEELDMTSILMSSSGLDWEITDPKLIASTVVESVEPGSIVLLHDGHGDVNDPNAQDSRAASVEATDIIIKELKAQGYRFVTVGELIQLSK